MTLTKPSIIRIWAIIADRIFAIIMPSWFTVMTVAVTAAVANLRSNPLLPG